MLGAGNISSNSDSHVSVSTCDCGSVVGVRELLLESVLSRSRQGTRVASLELCGAVCAPNYSALCPAKAPLDGGCTNERVSFQ